MFAPILPLQSDGTALSCTFLPESMEFAVEGRRGRFLARRRVCAVYLMEGPPRVAEEVVAQIRLGLAHQEAMAHLG